MARLWLSRCTGPRWSRSSQLRLSRLATVPVRMIALELVTLEFRDLRHGGLQRDLDLRKRRDRHPAGQVVVEHPVLAQVGMASHEIPRRWEFRNPAQWPTISQAWGRSTATVVRRGLGVGRAHADVHERDPPARSSA